MNEKKSMSSHVNNLMSLFRQLSEVGTKVEDEDEKSILLNSLASSYSNVVFTLSQMSPQKLDETIATLLAKEKRQNLDYTKGNS